MLNIIFGDVDNLIFNTELYFNINKEDDWLVKPISKEMILDIDKSEVIAPGIVKSPIFGMIPPEKLSGGVKTLMLIDNVPDRLFCASHCGDNCAKWLLKIAETKDVTVNLGHIMEFPEPFRIKICNCDKIVTTAKDYILTAIDYV